MALTKNSFIEITDINNIINNFNSAATQRSITNKSTISSFEELTSEFANSLVDFKETIHNKYKTQHTPTVSGYNSAKNCEPHNAEPDGYSCTGDNISNSSSYEEKTEMKSDFISQIALSASSLKSQKVAYRKYSYYEYGKASCACDNHDCQTECGEHREYVCCHCDTTCSEGCGSDCGVCSSDDGCSSDSCYKDGHPTQDCNGDGCCDTHSCGVCSDSCCDNDCCNNDYCSDSYSTCTCNQDCKEITYDTIITCSCDSVCSEYYNYNTLKGNNKGYLVCNSYVNTSKILPNLLANGNVAQVSGLNFIAWSDQVANNTFQGNQAVSIIEPNSTELTSGAGYRTWRRISIQSSSSQQGNLIQFLHRNLIQGHVYYLSFYMIKATTEDLDMNNIYCGISYSGMTDSDSKSSNLWQWDDNLEDWPYKKSLGGWQKISFRFTWGYSNNNTHYFSLWHGRGQNSSNTYGIDVTKFILVDLTDGFGSGQEPSKDWCDNCTREHEIFSNYGCFWPVHTSTGNSSDIWNKHISSATCSINTWGFKYLKNKSWTTHSKITNIADYGYRMDSIIDWGPNGTSQPESWVYCYTNSNIDPSTTYYVSYDAFVTQTETTLFSKYVDYLSTEIYWGGGPSEPPLGGSQKNGIPPTKILSTTDWKRIGFLEKRPFKAGSYPMRLDFNHNYTSGILWFTNITCCDISESIKAYNYWNNCNITLSDINSHWCERWIDNRNSTFIHIGDPNYTSPVFTDGILYANSIDIRPETNQITTNNTYGKISCKKLIILDLDDTTKYVVPL